MELRFEELKGFSPDLKHGGLSVLVGISVPLLLGLR